MTSQHSTYSKIHNPATLTPIFMGMPRDQDNGVELFGWFPEGANHSDVMHDTQTLQSKHFELRTKSRIRHVAHGTASCPAREYLERQQTRHR